MPCETVTIPAPQQQPENGGEDGRGEEQVSREDVTGIFGYAKFRRADDALDAAMMLGLDGIHSHQMNGNTIYMPGKTHRKLNEQLSKLGLEQAGVPGSSADEDGGGISSNAAIAALAGGLGLAYYISQQ
jgi:hypothetical protein